MDLLIIVLLSHIMILSFLFDFDFPVVPKRKQGKFVDANVTEMVDDTHLDIINNQRRSPSASPFKSHSLAER